MQKYIFFGIFRFVERGGRGNWKFECPNKEFIEDMSCSVGGNRNIVFEKTNLLRERGFSLVYVAQLRYAIH